MSKLQLSSTGRVYFDQLFPDTDYLCEDTHDGEKIAGVTDSYGNFIVLKSAEEGFKAGFCLTEFINNHDLKHQFVFTPVNIEIHVKFIE